jgi:hypothetical protein
MRREQQDRFAAKIFQSLRRLGRERDRSGEQKQGDASHQLLRIA